MEAAGLEVPIAAAFGQAKSEKILGPAFSSGGKIVERKDDGGKRREDADLEAILTSGRRTMQKIPLSSRHSGTGTSLAP